MKQVHIFTSSDQVSLITNRFYRVDSDWRKNYYLAVEPLHKEKQGYVIRPIVNYCSQWKYDDTGWQTRRYSMR